MHVHNPACLCNDRDHWLYQLSTAFLNLGNQRYCPNSVSQWPGGDGSEHPGNRAMEGPCHLEASAIMGTNMSEAGYLPSLSSTSSYCGTDDLQAAHYMHASQHDAGRAKAAAVMEGREAGCRFGHYESSLPRSGRSLPDTGPFRDRLQPYKTVSRSLYCGPSEDDTRLSKGCYWIR